MTGLHRYSQFLTLALATVLAAQVCPAQDMDLGPNINPCAPLISEQAAGNRLDSALDQSVRLGLQARLVRSLKLQASQAAATATDAAGSRAPLKALRRLEAMAARVGIGPVDVAVIRRDLALVDRSLRDVGTGQEGDQFVDALRWEIVARLQRLGYTIAPAALVAGHATLEPRFRNLKVDGNAAFTIVSRVRSRPNPVGPVPPDGGPGGARATCADLLAALSAMPPLQPDGVDRILGNTDDPGGPGMTGGGGGGDGPPPPPPPDGGGSGDGSSRPRRGVRTAPTVAAGPGTEPDVDAWMKVAAAMLARKLSELHDSATRDDHRPVVIRDRTGRNPQPADDGPTTVYLAEVERRLGRGLTVVEAYLVMKMSLRKFSAAEVAAALAFLNPDGEQL